MVRPNTWAMEFFNHRTNVDIQNRTAGKATRYFTDEFHLLLKEEQTAAYSVQEGK